MSIPTSICRHVITVRKKSLDFWPRLKLSDYFKASPDHSIAGNFCMVQIFVVFVDWPARAKIKATKLGNQHTGVWSKCIKIPDSTSLTSKWNYREFHFSNIYRSIRCEVISRYMLCLQFQQERINTFCRHNFMVREKHFPEGSELDAFYRHLMFDDAQKAIYCFVPKVSGAHTS